MPDIEIFILISIDKNNNFNIKNIKKNYFNIYFFVVIIHNKRL